MEASLTNLGTASRICTVVCPTTKPAQDYQRFERRLADCFVIDMGVLPKDTTGLEIGVWAVPERNQASFESYHRDVPTNMLYKVTGCEPQVWVYARPAQGWFS